MKKVLSIAVVALFVSASLVSCKKDYTCECKVTVGGQVYTSSTTIKDTKAKAKTACEANQTSYMGVTYVCAIK